VARMGEWRGVYRVLIGRPGRKNDWEDLGVGGKITLRLTLGRRIDGVNWIRLGQYRFWWRAFVSTVMNLRVP
jgi:hypothetical protein